METDTSGISKQDTERRQELRQYLQDHAFDATLATEEEIDEITTLFENSGIDTKEKAKQLREKAQKIFAPEKTATILSSRFAAGTATSFTINALLSLALANYPKAQCVVAPFISSLAGTYVSRLVKETAEASQAGPLSRNLEYGPSSQRSYMTLPTGYILPNIVSGALKLNKEYRFIASALGGVAVNYAIGRWLQEDRAEEIQTAEGQGANLKEEWIQAKEPKQTAEAIAAIQGKSSTEHYWRKIAKSFLDIPRAAIVASGPGTLAQWLTESPHLCASIVNNFLTTEYQGEIGEMGYPMVIAMVDQFGQFMNGVGRAYLTQPVEKYLTQNKFSQRYLQNTFLPVSPSNETRDSDINVEKSEIEKIADASEKIVVIDLLTPIGEIENTSSENLHDYVDIPHLEKRFLGTDKTSLIRTGYIEGNPGLPTVNFREEGLDDFYIPCDMLLDSERNQKAWEAASARNEPVQLTWNSHAKKLFASHPLLCRKETGWLSQCKGQDEYYAFEKEGSDPRTEVPFHLKKTDLPCEHAKALDAMHEGKKVKVEITSRPASPEGGRAASPSRVTFAASPIPNEHSPDKLYTRSNDSPTIVRE